MNKKLISVVAHMTMILPAMASAQTVEERGLEIAIEADKRNQGWQDSTADMEMLLINKRGDESTRDLRVKSLEMETDGDKSLTIFDSPKDVRGTALLTFSHYEDADDQWLYLPALKRVKRISSNNKSGPFMGSEFSFEDFSPQEVTKYNYKYIKDETCGNDTCFVIEQFPKDKKSGYTRQMVWLDQTEYRIQKIDFYDRKGAMLKTLTASGYKQYLSHYWRPGHSLMENHQTGKKTILSWGNYQFKNNLKESDFSKNSLKRSR